MPSVLRSVAVLAFASAVAVMAASGCSQQGQGERCDFAKNGDQDCDSGLTCVKSAELADHVTDRCCPLANTETDSRCARGAPESTTGGTSGTGGTTGSGNGGAAGEPAAGSPSLPTAEGGMSSGGAPADASAGTPADASAGTGGAG